MAHDPLNPGQPQYFGPRSDNYVTWLVGAMAVIAFFGIIFWASTLDQTNTAANRGDTNTGVVTTTAPQP